MKTVYIPKGATVHYESLVTDRLVVKGCLEVTGSLKAKTISGGGVVSAGSVSADAICLDELEASYTVCKWMFCKRVESAELFASESAAVSCFLSAAYVEAGKLTVALSEIDEVKAEEIINLPVKKRGLLRTLLASALRSFLARWTTPAAPGEVSDAQNKQAQTDGPGEADSEDTAEPAAAPEDPVEMDAPVDEELNRFVNMFKLLRNSGYTLRIIPGTPEENAPVFDFDQERIIQKAA